MNNTLTTRELADFINAWPIGDNWYMDDVNHEFYDEIIVYINDKAMAINPSQIISYDQIDGDLGCNNSSKLYKPKTMANEVYKWLKYRQITTLTIEGPTDKLESVKQYLISHDFKILNL